jgi:hypothetical protein
MKEQNESILYFYLYVPHFILNVIGKETAIRN